jgi:hypothetical protein
VVKAIDRYLHWHWNCWRRDNAESAEAWPDNAESAQA